MITLNTKTLNSFNSLISPETTFGTNLEEMCAIGEWKELEFAYTYDVVIGSAPEDIIGKDIYFTPALFNRGGDPNPSPTSTIKGYWANLVNGDIGNDVEMILVSSGGVLSPSNINYKCYINTSDGFDFTIKFQFYLTHDCLSFNNNNGSYNSRYRFLKNVVTNPLIINNTGTNTCVYDGKAILDTYLKVNNIVNNTSEFCRERLDFYATFYNSNPYYNTPLFVLKDSGGNVITQILNEDCLLEFTVNKPAGNAAPHLVGMLIRTDISTSTDLVTNSDLSMVECDTAQIDNHIKLPTLDFALVGGDTYNGSYTIDGAALLYGAKYRFISICYSEDMSEKVTASFISDDYLVNCKATVVKNAQDEGMFDYNTKEFLNDDRKYNGPVGISYILERIAFNGLSIFDPAENVGHPYASIDGFEKYCTRIEMRLYTFDGIYKYTHAQVEILGIDWLNGTFDFVWYDSEYADTSIGDPLTVVYKKEFAKATNIQNYYFFDWWIRSRCEAGNVLNRYLPAFPMNKISSNYDKYWGGKSFGIDYIYTFNYPGWASEFVVNSFDDIFEVKDFDNNALVQQTTFISTIKDTAGKDLNVRKYICDTDADLILDNDGLWLPVKCKLDDSVDGGYLSVMLSTNPTNQYNIQEVNKEIARVGVANLLEPLDMLPQITDATLVRNMVGWTTISGQAGSASFELNINKLVPGQDYRLYVIHVLTVET